MWVEIGKVLFVLEDLLVIWYYCLVVYSVDDLFFIGVIFNLEGIYIFFGFSSLFILVFFLVKRFVNYVVGEND